MTLNQVLSRLQAIAEAHKQIESFYYGNASDALSDISGKVKYPICIVQHSASSVSAVTKLTTHNFRVFLLDMVNLSNGAAENETEVISDMMTVAQDLIALAKDSSYSDTWLVEGNSQLATVKDSLADVVAGVAFDLPISSLYVPDVCEAPTDTLPEDTVRRVSAELITISATPPADPYENQLWLDIS